MVIALPIIAFVAGDRIAQSLAFDGGDAYVVFVAGDHQGRPYASPDHGFHGGN